MAASSEVNSLVPEFISTLVEELDYHPWLFSAIASMLVGLSGILPLLVIPIDETAKFKDGAGAATLRVLLSFAVGGLLGDVFLHLLPEAWANDMANSKDGATVSMKCGLWVLFGMLLFILVEKLFEQPEEDEGAEADGKSAECKEEVKPNTNGYVKANGHLEIEDISNLIEFEKKNRLMKGKKGDMEEKEEDFSSCLFNNNSVGSCSEDLCSGIIADGESRGRCVQGNRWLGRCIRRDRLAIGKQPDKQKHVAGYLNLMANSIDNFTHGLAVGGSFLVGFRVGALTTFAILVHEIPHEVGDFAILLKSGFTRWEAAKAQMATASAGLIGAMAAVIFSGARNSIEARTSWITPFTAGGFLHIALVTVLPDLLREKDKAESLKQLSALLTGIGLMAFMTHYFA